MSAADSLSPGQFQGDEVWRGLHGRDAAETADAHRRGEPGMDGVMWAAGIPLASTYAQAHQGDRTGVMMRGRMRTGMRLAGHAVALKPGDVQWEPGNYTVGQAMQIDDQRKGYEPMAEDDYYR